MKGLNDKQELRNKTFERFCMIALLLLTLRVKKLLGSKHVLETLEN